MLRTAKKSTDSRIFMAMRPVGPASVHKVRLLPPTLTLSFFSFPWFLALHHQSLACNSRFALASVRKIKRLKPRRLIRLRLFIMTTHQWEGSSWVLKWSKAFSLSRREFAIAPLLQHMFALNSACNRGSTHCGPIFTQDNWRYRV